jgi:hypothetical protein
MSATIKIIRCQEGTECCVCKSNRGKVFFHSVLNVCFHSDCFTNFSVEVCYKRAKWSDLDQFKIESDVIHYDNSQN